MAKAKAKPSKKSATRAAAPTKKAVGAKRPVATSKKPARAAPKKKVVTKSAKSMPAKKKIVKVAPKATATPKIKTPPKTAAKPAPTPVQKVPLVAKPSAAKTMKAPAKPIAAPIKQGPIPIKSAPISPPPTASVADKKDHDKKLKPDTTKKSVNAKTAPKAESKPARKVINLDEVKLPNGYRPSPNEEYMGPTHLAYFKRKLQNWRQELIVESQETLEHLRTETRDVGDEAERASRESDNILELRTRDRYRKLLYKIDQALKRIEDGAYGFCEETGEEIGLGRLEARPIATLTVDAQERRELFQRQFRDDH